MEYATTTRNQNMTMPILGGQVGEYAAQTETALTGLHNLLDQLASRLEPALTAVVPMGSAPATAPPKAIASPFGERLRAQAVGVQNAAARLEELIGRLDF